MKKERVFLLVCLVLFSISFVLAADVNLRINTALDSVDIDGRLKVETSSDSLGGFDSNDLEASTDYDNYSLLYSVVSGRDLIVDSRPSAQNFTANFVYSVSAAQAGELVLSWSYSNENYPTQFYYYGYDSSRNDLVENFSLSSQSSFTISEYNGSNIYFSLGVGYIPSLFCGDGFCNNGETSQTCSIDCSQASSCIWLEQSRSQCNSTNQTLIVEKYSCSETTRTKIESCNCFSSETWSGWSEWSSCLSGLSTRTQTSSCGRSNSSSQSCCTPSIVYGSWSSCQAGTQTRLNTTLLSNCTQIDKYDSRSCQSCQENWQCSWSPCQNGFYQPLNCNDANNCGTNDNRPSAISCSLQAVAGGGGGGGGGENIDPSCVPSITCQEWGLCKVETSFEDLKNPNNVVEGIRTRSCVDSAGCLRAPYFEEEKCSVKISTESKKAVICGQEYIEIYESGTDYLLARIKDDRKSVQRALGIIFFLGGKAEETPCEEPLLGPYALRLWDKVNLFFDLRNVAEEIRER